MIAPGLDVNLDHEPSRELHSCDVVAQSDSAGLTTRWREACVSLELPRVNFHALRHTHASMLIHRGVNVVKISQRLGHKNPTVTLNIYAHLFDKNDKEAIEATEAAMTTKLEPTSL